MPLNPLDRASLLLRRNQTLGTIMERLAKVHGRRRLVEEAGDGLLLTYPQASKRVNRWAGGIAAKIERGDRVVIATPNGYEMLLLCLAASRAGGIPVPVNPQMRPDEVRHVIDDSAASLVLRAASAVDGAEPLADACPFEPNDVAALFYTSGTTGKPKGVELTHRSLVGQVAIAARCRPSSSCDPRPCSDFRSRTSWDSSLSWAWPAPASPCTSCPGFVQTRCSTRSSNATRRSSSACRRCTACCSRRARSDVTSPPSVCGDRVPMRCLPISPRSSSNSARRRACRSSVLSVKRCSSRATGWSSPAVGLQSRRRLRCPRSVSASRSAFALPGYKFRIVDEDGKEVGTGQTGELLLKGPGVTPGYWGDAAATGATITDDGWLRTGDSLAKVCSERSCSRDGRRTSSRAVATPSTRSRSNGRSRSIPTCSKRRWSALPTIVSARFPARSFACRRMCVGAAGRAHHVGGRATCVVQGSPPDRLRRRSAADRHPQGAEDASCSRCSTSDSCSRRSPQSSVRPPPSPGPSSTDLRPTLKSSAVTSAFDGSTSTSQFPELSRQRASVPYGRCDGGWMNSTPLA